MKNLDFVKLRSQAKSAKNWIEKESKKSLIAHPKKLQFPDFYLNF
ncbi:MAG: hypothetical protein ACOVLC_10115 [Flavobacterium sp.]